MREVVIVSAVRTPVGRALKGTLRDTRPDDLAGLALRTAIERSGVPAKDLEDVVLGCAMPEAEQGMNVARISASIAGIPVEVPAMTVNRFCASGLQAVAAVAERILAGAIDAGVAGGVESMTFVPMGGHKPAANPGLIDSFPEVYTPMGITAENVARRFGVTREDQDKFALDSHKRAAAAWETKQFDAELVPVATKLWEDGGARAVTLSRDELLRPDTTLEGLAKLRPAFDPTGSVTAGNSSPLSDGAAAVVLMERSVAAQRGLKPLAVFRGFATAGVPPDIMGIGPVPAVRKLLQKTGVKLADVDHVELNEAFAAQALYCVRELGFDPARVNPFGGAIALGHPLGATGAKLTATVVHALQRGKKRYGIVSMCIGGGMGAAGLFERA